MIKNIEGETGLKSPSLRFKGFSGVWEEKKVKDIFETTRGNVLSMTLVKSDSQGKYIYPVYSSQTKNNGLAGYFENYLFEDCITWTTDGAGAGDVKYRRGKFYCTNVCGVLKSNTGYANLFIAELLNSISRRFVSYVGNPKLMNNVMSEINIIIPKSLPEQTKIAEFLTSVDDRITSLKTKKSLLEEYKKGVMARLLGQQIRFRDTDGNNYPDWEEKKLGEVAKINMGQSPLSESYNQNANGMYLIQGNADLFNRLTSPRNWTTHITKQCNIGDIILTVRAPVGAVAKSIHNACIGRGVCSVKNLENTNIEYIYQFLLNHETKWTNIEQGSTFTAVSNSDIKNIKIPLPSLPEQTKIAEFLTSLDDSITLINDQIKKTEEYKKGLLQKMFV